MLYSERKRLKGIVEREAKGESVWSSSIPAPLRTKLKRIIKSYGWVANEFNEDFGSNQILGLANAIFARERGEVEKSIIGQIDYCIDDDMPDIIESVCLAIRYYANEGVKKPGAVDSFHVDINQLLESYRINYSLENCEVIEFDSREIHTAIISPTLRLISREGWEKVEASYQDGLKELSAGNSSDAITDVTTALQEALRELGCKGGDLATLLKSAKNTILKGYDSKYVQAVDNLVSWTSANRANRGDSHKVAKVDKDDAWFVVHTVGILILRLSKLKKSK